MISNADWHGWSSHTLNEIQALLDKLRLMPPNDIVEYKAPYALHILDHDVVWVGFETDMGTIGLVVFRVD